MPITQHLATFLAASLVAGASAQIRTATIPSGTVRGGATAPSAGTPTASSPPPVVTLPAITGSLHHCYYGCGCYRGRHYSPWSGYYYDRGPWYDRSEDAVPNAGLIYALEPEQPEPLTTEEQARQALTRGNFNVAARQFAEAWAEQVKEEGEPDHTIQRLWAISLFANGQGDKGVTELMEAYEADPSLTDRPVSGDTLFENHDLRRLVRRAVRDAHRAGTYENWFLVAVLMQAEGRHQLAARMLERAESARTSESPASS